MKRETIEKKFLELYKKLFGTAEQGDKDKNTGFDCITMKDSASNVWGMGEQLSVESRSMIKMALLAALGKDHELKKCIRGTVNTGIDKKTINGIMAIVAHYAGLSAGQKGVEIAQKAIEEKSLCKAKSSAEKRIVFCDFDRTITTQETFEGMFRIFAPHDADKILNEVKNGTKSIKFGVKELLKQIKPIYFDDIKEYYIECAKIRKGFKAFLKFLSSNNVDFVIISGGFKEMVWEVLKKYDLLKLVNYNNIYGATVYCRCGHLDACCDFNGCDFESDELVPKISAIIDYIIKNNNGRQLELVFIGDGKTDEIVAKSLVGSPGYAHYLSGYAKSSVVFARDELSELLKSDPYFSWDDFTDIQKCLARRWQL